MIDNNSIKIILLGDSNVGKSRLCHKYTHTDDLFIESSTIGVEFFFKSFWYEGYRHSINIWDTAGQERFRSLVKIYFRDADAAIIVFDIISHNSFNSLKSWIDLFNKDRPNKQVFIIANKIDLLGNYKHDEIDSSTIDKFLLDNKLLITKFYEVSAKSGKNVKATFKDIIETIIKNRSDIFYEIDLNTYDSDETIELLDKDNDKTPSFFCCI